MLGGQVGIELILSRSPVESGAADKLGGDRRQHRRADNRRHERPQADVGGGRGVDDQPLTEAELDAVGQAASAGVGAGQRSGQVQGDQQGQRLTSLPAGLSGHRADRPANRMLTQGPVGRWASVAAMRTPAGRCPRWSGPPRAGAVMMAALDGSAPGPAAGPAAPGRARWRAGGRRRHAVLGQALLVHTVWLRRRRRGRGRDRACRRRLRRLCGRARRDDGQRGGRCENRQRKAASGHRVLLASPREFRRH